MNSHHEFDDSRQLDRLVDGELVSGEYRDLLATLDKQPDGWRRCAMAFLEAQAWEQELSHFPEEVRLGRRAASSQLVTRKKRSWSKWQVWEVMLAAAALLAVAFASGIWWEVRSSSTSEPDLPKLARQNGDSRPMGIDDIVSPEAERSTSPSGFPSELVTFVVDRDDGETDRFELPIYEVNDSRVRQLLEESPSMPADVERAIRDSGYQVKRQRQWARVRLRDGRRAFFPVDQLDITPVSGNIYH